MPRSKTHNELSNDDQTSIMIIPDFDLEVDSGKYECITTNVYGTTAKFIYIDKDALKLEKNMNSNLKF